MRKHLLIYFTILSCFHFSGFNTNAQTSSVGQESKGLTGSWNGLRTVLLNQGMRFNAIYTGEMVSNLSGGRSQNSDYLDVVDLVLEIDLDKFVYWKNASFYLNLIGMHGGNPSDYIGDFQGVSNIAAAMNTWKVYEIWLQQNFMKERFSVLFGLYDLNSEFDVLETAGLFFNSSHGMGAEFAQSGKNGPSTFPSTALALRLKTHLSQHFCIQTALVDGVPDEANGTWWPRSIISQQDGALVTAEIAYLSHKEEPEDFPWRSKRKQIQRRRRGGGQNKKSLSKSNRSPRRMRGFGRRQRQHRWRQSEISQKRYSKLALGGWYYTSEFEFFDAVNSLKYQRSWGIYVLREKTVFFKSENPERCLSYFLRLGISNKNVNTIDTYFGSGIVFSGIFSRVHADQIGLAVAAAHISDQFKTTIRNEAAPHDNWEINVELSYRAEINAWCSIQPDLQYIMNPGFNPVFKNALSLGTRLEICF